MQPFESKPTDLVVCRGGSRAPALGPVHFRVPSGLLTVVCGDQHSGKTSLLRLMLNLDRLDLGEVRHQWPGWQQGHWQKVLRLGLRLPRFLPWHTPTQVLQALPHYRRLLDPSGWAQHALSQVGLHEVVHQKVWTLSREQRVRLWVAMQLLPHSSLMVFDEPLKGLTPAERACLWLLFRRLVWEGRAVVVTTPCLQEAEQYGEYLVLLQQGKVLAQGEFGQFTIHRRMVLEVSDPAGAVAVLHSLGYRSQVSQDPHALLVDLSMAEAARVLDALRKLEVEVQECRPEGLLSLYSRLKQQDSGLSV